MSELENDDLFGIGDIVDVQDQAFGSMYPIVQWVNGDPTKKKSGGIDFTGGFFVSAEQGIELPNSKPFTLFTQSGDEIEGFAATELPIIPIRYRRSWLAQPSEKGLQVRFPWNAYEEAKSNDHNESPRGRGQMLCLVEGMEEPIVLSFGGMVSAAVFSQSNNRGILPTFGQLIVHRARQLASRAGRTIDYPLCAFKMNLAPESKDGEPVFTSVGSGTKTNKIVKPMWTDKPTGMASEADVKRVFVGRELFGRTQEIHKDGDTWVSQWSVEILAAQLQKILNKADLGINKPAAAGGLPDDQAAPF